MKGDPSSPDPKEKEIFSVARTLLDPKGRAEYLDRACAGDQKLRAKVEELLVNDAGNSTLSGVKFAATSPKPIEIKAGTMIGPFMVLEKIGKGGGGVVYRAQEQRHVKRLVALKLVTPGLDAPSVEARFQHERQMLADLKHPGIVSFFQAGTSGSKLGNSLFFTMEYVSDQSITAYADSHRLDIQERLEMFLELCKAVAYIHENKIIHRDIKPQNVLVTEIGGKPFPKLIDFGIAKGAREDDSTETTFATKSGHFIGTPNYMSPEQAEGTEVDNRTDIYSLGVLLHELLVGCVPFTLAGMGFSDQLRTIREDKPEIPSTKFKSFPEKEALRIARARRTEPSRLVASLQGELDRIVIRCLEKKSDDRYDTAMSLGGDIEKWLETQAHAAEVTPPKKLVALLTIRELALLLGLLFVAVAAVTAIVILLSGNQHGGLTEDDVTTPDSLMTLTMNTLRNEPRALTEDDVRTPDSLIERMIDNLKNK